MRLQALRPNHKRLSVATRLKFERKAESDLRPLERLQLLQHRHSGASPTQSSVYRIPLQKWETIPNQYRDSTECASGRALASRPRPHHQKSDGNLPRRNLSVFVEDNNIFPLPNVLAGIRVDYRVPDRHGGPIERIGV